MPPYFVGIGEYSEAAYNNFVRATARPMANGIAQELTKKLLMERNHMSEEEAHRYMQKCSMDSGNNMVETAKMIFALMKY